MAKTPRMTTARTKTKRAGKPVVRRAVRAAAGARPTAAELDLRDRLKSQPRRPAGPPLVGDLPTAAVLRALRNETRPKPTDPKNRRTGR
jgi:hypothetical protein